MNKITTTLSFLLFAFFTCLFPRCKSKPSGSGVSFSTSAEDRERISQLGLDKRSEDASYILDSSRLSIPRTETVTEDTNYRADPAREWIINLEPSGGGHFKKEDLLNTFDAEFRGDFPLEFYGRLAGTGRWTFAFAGDVSGDFDQIQVGVDLTEVYKDQHPAYDPAKLERYLDGLKKQLASYPAPVKMAAAEPIAAAIAKAKKLVQLYLEFGKDAIIVLQGSHPFKGETVWDVLQSAGLSWGDGDLFHWPNEHDYGHAQHFSVWTSTRPGYFLPEDIRDGSMNPGDLVFGFSIPRSADPGNIFDIMLNTVKYCQKRLGGRIVDQNGNPFNEVAEKAALLQLVANMKAKGIVPGSDQALTAY